MPITIGAGGAVGFKKSSFSTNSKLYFLLLLTLSGCTKSNQHLIFEGRLNSLIGNSESDILLMFGAPDIIHNTDDYKVLKFSSYYGSEFSHDFSGSIKSARTMSCNVDLFFKDNILFHVKIGGNTCKAAKDKNKIVAYVIGVNLTKELNGFKIKGIYPGSPISNTIVNIGDIITGVEGVTPSSLKDFSRIIKQNSIRNNTRKSIFINVNKNGENIKIKLLPYYLEMEPQTRYY